ncbi:hypothetical protein HDU76_004183 [Blyttiomyces sp. JEL0837]|nr:hypothetical protein HDU76_004183 [Blyttiomyces sp. JEL0837]
MTHPDLSESGIRNGMLTRLRLPWSDGDPINSTKTSEWTIYPADLYLEKLSPELIKIYRHNPSLIPGINAEELERGVVIPDSLTLESLPHGYRLMGKPRIVTAEHVDKYLFGHPRSRGSKFRSPKEFLPHLIWLATDRTRNHANCKCHHCTKSRALHKRPSAISSAHAPRSAPPSPLNSELPAERLRTGLQITAASGVAKSSGHRMRLSDTEPLRVRHTYKPPPQNRRPRSSGSERERADSDSEDEALRVRRVEKKLSRPKPEVHVRSSSEGGDSESDDIALFVRQAENELSRQMMEVDEVSSSEGDDSESEANAGHVRQAEKKLSRPMMEVDEESSSDEGSSSDQDDENDDDYEKEVEQEDDDDEVEDALNVHQGQMRRVSIEKQEKMGRIDVKGKAVADRFLDEHGYLGNSEGGNGFQGEFIPSGNESRSPNNDSDNSEDASHDSDYYMSSPPGLEVVIPSVSEDDEDDHPTFTATTHHKRILNRHMSYDKDLAEALFGDTMTSSPTEVDAGVSKVGSKGGTQDVERRSNYERGGRSDSDHMSKDNYHKSKDCDHSTSHDFVRDYDRHGGQSDYDRQGYKKRSRDDEGLEEDRVNQQCYDSRFQSRQGRSAFDQDNEDPRSHANKHDLKDNCSSLGIKPEKLQIGTLGLPIINDHPNLRNSLLQHYANAPLGKRFPRSYDMYHFGKRVKVCYWFNFHACKMEYCKNVHGCEVCITEAGKHKLYDHELFQKDGAKLEPVLDSLGRLTAIPVKEIIRFLLPEALDRNPTVSFKPGELCWDYNMGKCYDKKCSQLHLCALCVVYALGHGVKHEHPSLLPDKAPATALENQENRNQHGYTSVTQLSQSVAQDQSSGTSWADRPDLLHKAKNLPSLSSKFPAHLPVRPHPHAHLHRENRESSISPTSAVPFATSTSQYSNHSSLEGPTSATNSQNSDGDQSDIRFQDLHHCSSSNVVGLPPRPPPELCLPAATFHDRTMPTSENEFSHEVGSYMLKNDNAVMNESDLEVLDAMGPDSVAQGRTNDAQLEVLLTSSNTHGHCDTVLPRPAPWSDATEVIILPGFQRSTNVAHRQYDPCTTHCCGMPPLDFALPKDIDLKAPGLEPKWELESSLVLNFCSKLLLL